MLKSNTEPSSPLTAANLRASATRSPSVASPSVMLMTIGGNPLGCSSHHVSVILVASLSAAHIGVPPFQYGSNQTGNLTVSSTTPPAPSSDFFTLSSMRSGLLANSLIDQRAPAQFTAERWFTAIFAVAQHTDVKVVVDGVRFGATDGQIMNKLVEYRRELLGLLSASLSAAKRVFHRL